MTTSSIASATPRCSVGRLLDRLHPQDPFFQCQFTHTRDYVPGSPPSFDEPGHGGGDFLRGIAGKDGESFLLAGGAVSVGDDRRVAPFASEPQGPWRAEGQEAGKVEVLRTARQELRVTVIEQFAEPERARVDCGTVDRIARDSAGGCDQGARAAKPGNSDRRGPGMPGDFGSFQVLHEGQDVVGTLSE